MFGNLPTVGIMDMAPMFGSARWIRPVIDGGFAAPVVGNFPTVGKAHVWLF